MIKISKDGKRESRAIANVDAAAEQKLVQIMVNGVTLMVEKLVPVEELLRKARGSSAILGSIDDYYIVTAEERDEYHLGASIEVSESKRYLAVPKRLANVA